MPSNYGPQAVMHLTANIDLDTFGPMILMMQHLLVMAKKFQALQMLY